jgi:predicted dehydrogenase
MVGPIHRFAVRLDDRFEIVAGVLSSNAERSLAAAATLGIPRAYTDLHTMLAAETMRPDGIDAVAVMTPNDSHYSLVEAALAAGLDVICDKPLTNDLASATALARQADGAGRVLMLTHNYTGYPMVREARSAVAAGDIGPLRLVNVRYLQGSLSRLLEVHPDQMPPRLRWRLDAERGGPSHVLSDIGVHAQNLLSFVTGQRISAVCADVGAAVPNRTAHDTAIVLLRLTDGTRGTLIASKVAAGAQNDIGFDLYGEAGGLSWRQAEANDLRLSRPDLPDEIRTRGLPGLSEHARRSTRLPVGHPEAFIEGFANIYADFAEQVAARLTGVPADPLTRLAPSGWDGVDSLAFVEACLESAQRGSWIEVPSLQVV